MSSETAAVGTAGQDPTIDRASRLFQFLARAQQLKSCPVLTVEAQAEAEHLIWLDSLPDHPAVRSAHRSKSPAADEPFLTVDRIAKIDAPAPGPELDRWLDGPPEDPDRLPGLLDEIPAEPSSCGQINLADRPETRDQYREWSRVWQAWAESERRDRPVRELYARVFAAYVAATSNTETMELVIGTSCLGWRPPEHPEVRRHMVIAPAAIELDDTTGRLAVTQVESRDALSVELDMLAPGLLHNPQAINEIRAVAQDFAGHPLDRELVGDLSRRLMHTLDATGSYRDDDTPPAVSDQALATFAPALLLRKRSQASLINIFNTIIDQLAGTDGVPDGILPLIDPDHQPAVRPGPADGAMITIDDEPFLPLPVNGKQLQVINAVDSSAQILVQGPPGTGKTHTAAALLSHLLAQGKRVLVTAQTDRALREVRDKLPDEIKPLSVAIVGTSREDMADLKVAVEHIANRAAERDTAAAEETMRRCLATIDELRRERARLHRELLGAREQEVTPLEHATYTGTLATIAQANDADSERYSWLSELVTVPADQPAPLTTEEALEWFGYLADAGLRADEPQARARLVDLAEVPTPEAFADFAHAESAASKANSAHAPLHEHSAYNTVRGLDPETRRRLQNRLDQLAETADALARRDEPWLNQALTDVRSGRANKWRSRAEQLDSLIARATPLIRQFDPLTQVDVAGDAGPLVQLAQAVRLHLESGGKIAVGPDGTPKVGLFTAKVIKQSERLFTHVRVNGLPATTTGQLNAFLLWNDATTILNALDRAWPDDVPIPTEDTLHERLEWHVTELQQLNSILQLAADLEHTETRLASLSMPRPDWNDLAAVRVYASLVDAAMATDAFEVASRPIQQLEQHLNAETRWSDTATCVQELLNAVQRRDQDLYVSAYKRIRDLHDVRERTARRDQLGARFNVNARALRDAVEADPHADTWLARLGAFARAWECASTATWIKNQEGADINALQARLLSTDRRIRDQVERLAATRAWSHAVSEHRITGTAKANLQQYAYLVRKLGKGTGSHAAQRRAEIRRAMDRCRPAVPVWIMPIYRIAEQLNIEPDMFDVVIVDEASQAGLEAVFLQYLASKIVVIGDDKQVSPAAVGVDQQQLRDLANQYLADDPFKDTWQDPQRSFFDEAKMRYGGLLTLTEHRRCVPEIIGFSNRIAYEPDGIRLVPVRQYGADRLEPIKPVFLSEGHTTGGGNPVEAEAIVAQIEKCIADPRYDGKTFGVISLLGDAQARKIESALLNRVHPDEWAARELRCGNPADFQGSERDVMFLSMVSAPEPGRTMPALTRELFVQRYNVAASRAKDQLWVFHSVAISDLRNKEDLRFQLLDYCYGVVRRTDSTAEGHIAAVPDDVRVSPFDSLFEQRVFNHLIDRGYTVIPQYEVERYRIDLVVVGPTARLAVECDGDHWHGPDVYERDLARQRDLERCGWKFFRIRESDFYIDRPVVLRSLWATLDNLDIHPSGGMSETPSPESTTHTQDPTIAAPTEISATSDVEGTEDIGQSTAVAMPAVGVTMAPAKPATAARSGNAVPEYREFSGLLPPVSEATRQQLIEAVIDIVAVEGPVIGSRIHTAYVKASGGQRVGRQIAHDLNSAITAAVRKGLLIKDNPLQRVGVKEATYRIIDQPELIVRMPGPRTLEEIPPLELATTIAAAAAKHGWSDEETVFKDALNRLGKKNLTKSARAALKTVQPLCEETRRVD
ncbi:AAA domain-containing protein [Saccharopolyspora sp. 5N102]|uniref:AAA domain-containing protein n=1 Tax=Saccharopolyspora sp. 5N102 TaxID=3375155 RepID=UPI0037AEC7C8